MALKSTQTRIDQDLCENSRSEDAFAGIGPSIEIGAVRPATNVFMAPLSGISDVPFRRLARRLGAGLVVSEMVASAEFATGDPGSKGRALRDGPGIHVVQLAGRDPAWMRAAAERLVADGVDVIDINMGCPAKKVVGGLSGSALMREPDLAARIIDATVAGAGTVPVTLKMRLGWDANSLNAAHIARRAQRSGVRMITVHGRTRAQFYAGHADWRAIRSVKQAVAVPVVANGDLVQPSMQREMLWQSGADAVMVGRGGQGRPWLPGLMGDAVDDAQLSRFGFADLVVEHYEDMLAFYGLAAGLRMARKHLGWYLDRFAPLTGVELASDRSAILQSDDHRSVIVRLKRLLGRHTLAEIEFAVTPDRSKAA